MFIFILVVSLKIVFQFILYVVSNGKVKLGTKSPDGRENLLMILGPGDMFGEL
ncbi:MAG: hypothetical protein EB127_28790, partial [Alphaproteobacteria bacterium]|nr:hypothetical protein [Alphaproteobacteria bacterium]